MTPSTRPVLLSLALHAGLLATLLAMRHDRPAADTPGVIQVEWVRLADGRAATAEPNAEPAQAAAPPAPREESLPDAGSAPAPAEPPRTADAGDSSSTGTPAPVAERAAETAPAAARAARAVSAAERGAEANSGAESAAEGAPGTEPAAELLAERDADPVAEADADPVAERDADAAVERETDIDPTVQREADLQAQRDRETAVAEAEPEPASNRTPENVPPDAPSQAQAASAQASAPRASAPPAASPEPPPRDPPPTPAPLPAPTPSPSDEPAPSQSAAAAPAAETLPLADIERRALGERIAEWTRRSRDLTAEPTVSFEHDGREYVATFTQLPGEDAMDIDEAIVEISTERDGRRLSTRMRMRRLAFSHYAQFVDRWDSDVQIHDDEIDGRFHSNSEIYVMRSGGVQPVFHGKVTTSRGVNTSHSSRRVRRDQMFLGGLETRVARISLPKRLPRLRALDEPGGDVLTVDADTRVTFGADGTYAFRALDAAAPERRGKLGDDPTYIVGADKVEIHVAGTVNGKVLVYSPEAIVIDDDLVYAADPASGPGSDDYLGLVSDGVVEVAGPDSTGPGDLTIHAAVYAKRRFAVTRYRSAEQGTLRLFGSLTAGSLSATEPRYRTKVEFDPRLEDARPPRFPMTDRYELAAWDGLWRAE